MKDFRKELEQLLNKYSKENGSNTPDFLLAEYLILSLELFDKTMNSRENWYSNSAKTNNDYIFPNENVTIV